MAKEKPILIVDDEKNIRLMIAQSMEAFGVDIGEAGSGDEALSRIQEKDYGVIILDLKLPGGMDGIEVLRRVRETRPDIRVIMISAYGTVDSAVEAMKLGAVDFIQKPFAAAEIRELVGRVLNRDRLEEQKAADYGTFVELAKRSIGQRLFDAAVEHVRKAISLDPSRPEAFNLLGVLMEVRHRRSEAQDQYRAALALDPTYEPARKNLHRLTHHQWGEGPSMGPGQKAKSSAGR
jgi:two-component system, OmpR family, alkaline phosphatase synthesis response regulator PhoP